MEMSLAFRKTLNVPYEEARARVETALKEQGFGVITEIDVKATVKEKIGEDFRKYTILGACNPHIAHQALSLRPEIGLLLPCNVVVTENASGGTDVWIVDPAAMIQFVPDPTGLEELMADARTRLEKAAAAL